MKEMANKTRFENARLISSDELKHVLCEITLKMQKYLNDNNITFFLIYGSLLGAVRHNGFIPWDDDIDLAVPRDQYIRLIHLLEKDNKLLEEMGLMLISPGRHKKAYHKRIKIADTRTFMIEYDEERPAAFIDIFPLDNIRNIDNWKYERKKYVTIDNLLALCYSGYVDTPGIRGLLYKVLLRLHKIVGLKTMVRFYENRLIRLYNKNSGFYSGVAEDENKKGEFSTASCFSDSVVLPFENLSLPAPLGYEEVLTNMYGDYMKLPPKDKRIAHHYQMYWKDS